MCVDYPGVQDVTGFLKKKNGLVILLLVEMFPGIVNNVQAVIKYFLSVSFTEKTVVKVKISYCPVLSYIRFKLIVTCTD